MSVDGFPNVAGDRAAATEWARSLLNRQDWCILDSETTGLGIWSEVVQLAIIDPRGDVLLDTLVKPTREIEEGARRIHGITDAMVADAPGFAGVYPRLCDAVRGKTIVVYNASFDRAMLLQSMHLSMGVDRPNIDGADDWQCAMLQYAAYCGEWSSYHQSYRFQRLPGGDHSALGDARATLRLLKRMAGVPNASITVPVMDVELRGYAEHYAGYYVGGKVDQLHETPLADALSAFVADLVSAYTDRSGSRERQKLAHAWLTQWRRDQGWRPIYEKQSE
jgi:DNA polymerase-3 subunit epsilon